MSDSGSDEGAPPQRKRVKFAAEGDDDGSDGDGSEQAVGGASAAEAVTFRLVGGSTPEEVRASIEAGGAPFKGEFFNQVFGEDEAIHGYDGDDVAVDVWLHDRTFAALVEVSGKAQQPQGGADDVAGLLAEWWDPQPLARARDEFVAQAASGAEQQDFSQLEEVPLPAAAGGAGGRSQLKLYRCALSGAPEWLRRLHARFEPLLVFAIDGASKIDADDERWELLVAVLEDGSQKMVGLLTLYGFYAWPLGQRPRVAQVMVLPPHRSLGIGKALVAAAYELARSREDAVDLTFEDPAPELQRLREKLEVEAALGLPSAVQAADAALPAAAAAAAKAGKKQQQQADSAAAAGPLALPAALSAEMTAKLKIHRHQAPAVWEGLLVARADGEQQLEAVRAAVRARVAAAAGAGADRSLASTKRLVEVVHEEGDEDEEDEGANGESWFVYKARRAGGGNAAGAGGSSGAAEAVDEDALEEAAAQRWQELMDMRGRLARA